jgi:hypothetical protein
VLCHRWTSFGFISGFKKKAWWHAPPVWERRNRRKSLWGNVVASTPILDREVGKYTLRGKIFDKIISNLLAFWAGSNKMRGVKGNARDCR